MCSNACMHASPPSALSTFLLCLLRAPLGAPRAPAGIPPPSLWPGLWTWPVGLKPGNTLFLYLAVVTFKPGPRRIKRRMSGVTLGSKGSDCGGTGDEEESPGGSQGTARTRVHRKRQRMAGSADQAAGGEAEAVDFTQEQ